MTDFKPVGGGGNQVAWGDQHNQSISVKDFVEAQGARPTAEFRNVGGKIEIRTGARVTRARTRFISFRRGWANFKTTVQTLTGARLAGVGSTRRQQQDIRHAGHKFDRGVNKLVEDMANGKLRDHVELSDRLGALHDHAKVLKDKDGDSDKDIADRFRTNLMESLSVLQKADSKRFQKVMHDLEQQLPRLDEFQNPPDSPQDRMNTRKLKQLEAEGLYDPGPSKLANQLTGPLRDAVNFGADLEKCKAFGRSKLMHDMFGGDADKFQAFNKDPAAFKTFGGDVAAYRDYGGNAALFEKFGARPADLEGGQGADRLTAWIDQAYGQGKADAFLQQNPEFRQGVQYNDLKTLGTKLTAFDNHKLEAETKANAVKEAINERFSATYGSTVGNKLVDMYLEGQDGTVPMLDAQEMRDIEDALAELPRTVNKRTVSQKLTQKQGAIPMAMQKIWAVNLKKSNTVHPTGDQIGNIDPTREYYGSSIRGTVDKYVASAQADHKHQEVADQFLKDLHRIDMYCSVDQDADIHLNDGNAVNTLNDLTRGDPDVTLNLSRFMQQAAFNGVEGAISEDLKNDQDEPVGVMPDQLRTGQSGPKSIRVDVKKDGGDYLINYQWKSPLKGFMGMGGTLETNAKTSYVMAKSTVRISEQNLKQGNLTNYEMSPVGYTVFAQVEPYSLINRQMA